MFSLPLSLYLLRACEFGFLLGLAVAAEGAVVDCADHCEVGIVGWAGLRRDLEE